MPRAELRPCCRYSPHVQSIKVLRSQHVRRAKLYYLRNSKPGAYSVS